MFFQLLKEEMKKTSKYFLLVTLGVLIISGLAFLVNYIGVSGLFFYETFFVIQATFIVLTVTCISASSFYKDLYLLKDNKISVIKFIIGKILLPILWVIGFIVLIALFRVGTIPNNVYYFQFITFENIAGLIFQISPILSYLGLFLIFIAMLLTSYILVSLSSYFLPKFKFVQPGIVIFVIISWISGLLLLDELVDDFINPDIFYGMGMTNSLTFARDQVIVVLGILPMLIICIILFVLMIMLLRKFGNKNTNLILEEKRYD